MKQLVLFFSVLVIFISCSSVKVSKENKAEMEAQKKKDRSLEETVRIENEVFQLVGCTMLKKVEVKNEDAKRIPFDIREKARQLGGNVLNDLSVRERFQSQGETIFDIGDKEYMASADVYRCHI
jgi:hypothetical protein